MPFSGFGFGSSSNSAQAQGSSQGSSQGSTFVDEAQAPFLDFLRNMAQGSFGGFQQGQQQFGQQAQQLGAQSAQAGGGGVNNPFLQSLFGQSQGNPELVQQQTDQLGEDLGRFFNEQLIPGINSTGQQAGQFGGSRGDIGRGLAAQGVTDQFQRGATQFQNADQQRALQAGQFGGQLFNQQQGQQGQLQLQGLGQAFNQFQGGFASQFDPLFALSQIFGGPNNLSQQSSEQSSQQTSSSSGSSFSVTGF